MDKTLGQQYMGVRVRIHGMTRGSKKEDLRFSQEASIHQQFLEMFQRQGQP